MGIRNNQIIVSSVRRSINRSKLSGSLDLKAVHIFRLLDYYLNFTQETIDNGSIMYITLNEYLKNYIREYTYFHSEDICNYKITTGRKYLNVTDPSEINTAPTVDGVSITLGLDSTYIFELIDFITNYQDAEGDSYNKLIIYLDSITGTFTYKNVSVSGTIEIPVENVTDLVLTRPDDSIYAETLTYRISDNNIYSLYSIVTSITLNGSAAVIENEPPTIGDGNVFTDNRITTILTLAMFTSLLAPPYNDPEGDLIDAIRIDSISGANQGIFYLNAIPVVNGLIITREQLAANLFTHVGPDADSLSSDFFTFSARDEGSLVWVN